MVHDCTISRSSLRLQNQFAWPKLHATKTSLYQPLMITYTVKLQVLKIRDFQKKIGIIYTPKQICRFTILNSSFEFSRVFGCLN